MFEYDTSRYLVGSNVQKQFEKAITDYKRKRRRARLFFGLLILVSLSLFFGTGYARHEQEANTAVVVVLIVSILCLMGRSIESIFTAQDKLKCIEANPAAHSAAQGWQGAQLVTDVVPERLTAALLEIMQDSAPGRAPIEACSQALRRLLDLHTHCLRPLPDLADAYLKAFQESWRALNRLDTFLLRWNQRDCPVHEEKVFSNDQLAEALVMTHQHLWEIARSIEQMVNKFESIVANTANSDQLTASNRGA